MSEKIYSITDDIPVNGIARTKKGKYFQVVLAQSPQRYQDDCSVCAFGKKSANWCSTVKCADGHRKDEENILFIRRKDLEYQESGEEQEPKQ